MRLLLFYQFARKYNFDNWLHLCFADKANGMHGVAIICYGPEVNEHRPGFVPWGYSPHHTADDLLKEFNPDAIVLMTKSRMFYNYHPPVLYGPYDNQSWLPKGLNKVQIPTIVLEEDYHYETDDLWYHQMGVDLILQRHYSAVRRQQRVPMRWFPFSVDTDVFRPRAMTKDRIDRICFIGSVHGPKCTHQPYPYRKEAIQRLEHAKCIDVNVKRHVVGQQYLDMLQKYRGYLCGSSRYHITPGKIFEIIASGGLLLMNKEPYLPQLFPEKCYFDYDPRAKNNDVVFQAVKLIARTPQAECDRLLELGWRQIKERHSHVVRMQQLKAIVEELK
jgi:hypothetical protein